MSVGLLELKEKYNKTLAREKKAEEFLNNASEEQQEKWNKEFLKIIIQLSRMIKQYRELNNEEMTKEEITGGFKGI